MSFFYRFGPLAGVGFAVLFLLAFLSGGSSPDSNDSDAKIAQYLGKTSSYHHSLAATIIAIVAIVLLVPFFGAVRTQLTTADPALSNHGTLALAASVGAAALLFAAVTLFTATPFAAHDARPATIDPDLYRLTQDIGFPLWVAGGGLAVVAVLAVAAAGFRSAAVPRWFAWVSLVLGVLTIGVIVFVGMFAFLLWALITGIALTVRPLAPAAAAP